jgi:hypothetical protein
VIADAGKTDDLAKTVAACGAISAARDGAKERVEEGAPGS